MSARSARDVPDLRLQAALQHHGSPDNITEQDFTTAGQTETLKQAGTVEAERRMLQLLQAELDHNELEKPKERY
jgi:hypothetical protein